MIEIIIIQFYFRIQEKNLKNVKLKSSTLSTHVTTYYLSRAVWCPMLPHRASSQILQSVSAVLIPSHKNSWNLNPLAHACHNTDKI
jgi:hypothetical protein